jgi:hypothetical protein
MQTEATTPEQLLLEFYKAYLDWVGRNAPELKPFTKGTGLCHNFAEFIRSNYTNSNFHIKDCTITLKDQFREANLDVEYPFNEGDDESYAYDVDCGMAHLNPARIQWVRDRVAGKPIEVVK